MHETRIEWTSWRQLFAARAARPLPALDSDHDYTRLPRSLARSLAIFQLGESGGGSLVEQARRSRLPGIDEEYASALALFVREEHRHGNILAVCVRLMGGRLIRRNWTAKLFVAGRRLMGLRLKILVLLAAEVVGLSFYGLIAARLPAGSLRDWLLEMVEDERSHLRFHADFLRMQIRNPVQQFVFTTIWRAVMLLSQLAVLIDHRRTLRDLEVEPKELRALWSQHRRLAEVCLLAAEPAVEPPADPAGCPS